MSPLAAVFDFIHVSIDAADSETNDRIRGKAGAYRHAVNALHLLERCKDEQPRLRFGVECTVVKPNAGSLPDFCKFVLGFRGLEFINISLAVPSGRASQEGFAMLLADHEIRELMGRADELRALVPPAISLSFHDSGSLKLDDEHCVQLNARGDVRAAKVCQATVGNLVETPLAELLIRAAAWRRAPLAQELPRVATFVAWRDLIRKLDHQVDNSAVEVPVNRNADEPPTRGLVQPIPSRDSRLVEES